MIKEGYKESVILNKIRSTKEGSAAAAHFDKKYLGKFISKVNIINEGERYIDRVEAYINQQ